MIIIMIILANSNFNNHHNHFCYEECSSSLQKPVINHNFGYIITNFFKLQTRTTSNPAARLPKVCQFNVHIGPGSILTLGLAQSPHRARPDVYIGPGWPNLHIGPGPISSLGQVQCLHWARFGPICTLGLAQSLLWTRPNINIVRDSWPVEPGPSLTLGQAQSQ